MYSKCIQYFNRYVHLVAFAGLMNGDREVLHSYLNLRLEFIKWDMSKEVANWTSENLQAARIFSDLECCFKQNFTLNFTKDNMICCPSGMEL